MEAVKDAVTALERLRATEYDMVLIDLSMQGRTGLQVISRAKTGNNHTEGAVISGNEPTQATGFKANGLGASQIFEKPLDYRLVLSWVRKVLEDSMPKSISPRILDEMLKERACIAGLSLEQFGQDNNLTLGHMTRLFNRAFDMMAQQRRNYHRVEQGKALLSSTDLPINEIASQCGFAQAASFSRTFRRFTGMTH